MRSRHRDAKGIAMDADYHPQPLTARGEATTTVHPRVRLEAPTDSIRVSRQHLIACLLKLCALLATACVGLGLYYIKNMRDDLDTVMRDVAALKAHQGIGDATCGN